MINFHSQPTTYVSHVALRVKDIEKSVKFYEDIMGFKVLKTTEEAVELTADGEKALLTLIYSNSFADKPSKSSGLYHFALLLPRRKDLASFLLHIAANRYPIGAADHQVSEAIYLEDPEGNGIEIYSDREPSEWNIANDFIQMTTDPLNTEDLLKEAKEAWTGLPEGTVMGHIHLHVSDLEKTTDFYVKGLGFDIVLPYYNAVFLSNNGYHHHIAINTWNGASASVRPSNSTGLAYYDITYGSQELLDKQLAALKNMGYELTKKENSYITTDPAGITIILSV
ncbi:MAG: VOC family protein [Clostridiaceae bacterium]